MSLPRFTEVPVERALSPTQIDLADFTLNPYKGCGVGCVYCYARSNRSLQKIGMEWGSFVHVKNGFVGLLEKEIGGRKNIGRVLIGSTTEPFQQAEETYHLTRGTLELLRSKNIPFVLLTKSPLAAGMAGRIGYSERNRVYITVNSETVRELFEKNSAPQNERMEAARTIANAGVRTVIYVSPVFPFLTDMVELSKTLAGYSAENIEFRAESYNPKMGNWKELRELLPVHLGEKYDRIYSGKAEYDGFWECFRALTEKTFSSHGLSIGIKIEPFDSWYSASSAHEPAGRI